jgi:hypothetical protein
MVLLLIDCESEQNYVFEFKCINDIKLVGLWVDKFVKCNPVKIAN